MKTINKAQLKKEVLQDGEELVNIAGKWLERDSSIVCKDLETILIKLLKKPDENSDNVFYMRVFAYFMKAMHELDDDTVIHNKRAEVLNDNTNR